MRSWKLITGDESTVLSKSLFDPLVVEDSEGNRRLSDPSRPDESDGLEAFSKFDDRLNQLIASEKVPRRWGRQFTTRHAMKT